jgi:hypothetical protein
MLKQRPKHEDHALVCWGGSRPRKQFYTGDQKKNQTVSATVARKAAALPLTTLLAVTLTVGEALVVAKAASVATITNAMVSANKMTSIISPTIWLRTAASVSLDHIGRSQRPDRTGETVRPFVVTPIDVALPVPLETVGQPQSSSFSPSQHLMFVSRTQLYAGGKKNQAVSATETRAAVKLPLTVLLAMPLTVRQALVEATAASVATNHECEGKLKADHVNHDHTSTASKHSLLWRRPQILYRRPKEKPNHQHY